MIHKISIIVDDLIDQDIRRHNASTFHIQYSKEETIIFAVYMIGTAFENIEITLCILVRSNLDFVSSRNSSKHPSAIIRNVCEYNFIKYSSPLNIYFIRNGLLF